MGLYRASGLGRRYAAVPALRGTHRRIRPHAAAGLAALTTGDGAHRRLPADRQTHLLAVLLPAIHARPSPGNDDVRRTTCRGYGRMGTAVTHHRRQRRFDHHGPSKQAHDDFSRKRSRNAVQPADLGSAIRFSRAQQDTAQIIDDGGEQRFDVAFETRLCDGEDALRDCGWYKLLTVEQL